MAGSSHTSRAGSVQSSTLGNHVSSSLDMSRYDRKKSRSNESDCTMVTLLQPSEMLKSELGLHEAARKNSVEQVRKLLAAKVDVNSRNNLDRTAIQWAAANGHVAVMEVLLSGGADIEAEDKYGMRALLWASWFGHIDATRMLVNNGANVHCSNRQGMNMLHCAAQNNHVTILQFIQDTLDGYKVDLGDKDDKTGLHLAAYKGNIDAVEKLLEMNCDLSSKDKLGQTAVHLAASGGHEDVLKKLLLVGVEVNDRDLEGRTALHLAAEGGHVRVVEALLSCTADPNAETTKEMTPLHVAASVGHVDVIMALVDIRCNLNAANYQGNTPLHLAAMNNHVKAVQTLIDANCTLDLANQRGQTALHTAVEAGLADVTEVLLIASADLNIREKMGKTALGLASRGSFVGLVDMIIKADRHHVQATEARVTSIQCSTYHHCFYSATCNAFSSRGRSRPGSGLEDKHNNNNIQFKRPLHHQAEPMKEILWRLATKQLRPSDWKKLAKHWKFTEDHIKAIEHQYTGNQSYREHGYRMLLIWLHGVGKDENPMRDLFEALTAIERRELAEQIRKKCNLQMGKAGPQKSCVVS